MRFCLASTQADWGGGEKLLWTIRSALVTSGHHVTWIVRRDEPLHRLVVQHGDPILAAPVRRGFNPRDWLDVRRGLRQWAPDALLLNDSHAIMLGGSAALAAWPVRPIRLAFRHVTFPLRSPFKLRAMSDAVVCVSSAAQESVVSAGIPRGKTLVIYGGCEVTEAHRNFERCLADNREARVWAESEFGLATDAPLLVCVGNLLDCKGHLSMVEAAALWREHLPAARLVIAGEGELREVLERRIAELKLEGYVRLLGFRRDADRLIQAASVVLHPSLQEGLSLVLIQAQLLHKLVVSTGVGGSAEVLGLGEERPCLAWLAKPGDPQSLSHQVVLAVEAWRRGESEFANELQIAAGRARDKFDIQKNVTELVNFVHHLRMTSGEPSVAKLAPGR